MKTNIAYVLIILVAAAGFLLAAEWLLYVAFAALLLTALVNFKSSGQGAGALPPGMIAPRQARMQGMQSGFGQRGAFDAHGQPLPKKKKKIRRPIIIVQPPAHSEALTHGILEESIKHSFPHFVTPQDKRKHEAEEREKEELMRMLKEQHKEMGELRKELEHVPGYRRKRKEDDEDNSYADD